MNRCMNTTFPSDVVGSVRAVADHPWAATSAAYTLCSMFAQTSPISVVAVSHLLISRTVKVRTVDLGQRLQAGVPQGIHSCGRRVRVRTDAGSIGGDILTKNIVRDSNGCFFVPAKQVDRILAPNFLSTITGANALCHGIRPSLTHATSLSSLQTATGSTASHSVGDAVGHLM